MVQGGVPAAVQQIEARGGKHPPEALPLTQATCPHLEQVKMMFLADLCRFPPHQGLLSPELCGMTVLWSPPEKRSWETSWLLPHSFMALSSSQGCWGQSGGLSAVSDPSLPPSSQFLTSPEAWSRVAQVPEPEPRQDLSNSRRLQGSASATNPNMSPCVWSPNGVCVVVHLQ